MSTAVGTASSPDAVTATCLQDLNIAPLVVTELVNPVVIVHAPRETGATSLIATLLSLLPGIDGVVVLTDRAVAPTYMNGALPSQLVLNKPADKVLKQLIRVQQHHLRHFPDEKLARLALAMDDVFYTPKVLKSEDFQKDIKIAKDFNITVIMTTADASLLPNNVHTFATHVFATRCISTEEVKLLHKRMFIMFAATGDLADRLALCKPYEFLVGLLRGSSHYIERVTRRLTTDMTVTKEHLPTEASLVEKLSLALDKL
jgi:hypothetical protein